ncbi:alpha-mannosidase I MNS5-like [Actinidia eriantha]|uniref:alpha-mannosidase I MNS5-like n=1 Tax=Actinidia eriantha TaxID=165200 RepID=UPI002585345C|nr:alpha-mannosidase I MNS5-like [Actinidia eriantha]
MIRLRPSNVYLLLLRTHQIFTLSSRSPPSSSLSHAHTSQYSVSEMFLFLFPRNGGTWILIFLVISPTIFCKSMSELDPRWTAKKRRMYEKVRNVFYHAYDNYMTYAFPHDELKPLTKTYTDSLIELGNLKLDRLPQEYNGSALTLVESLSSLVIMGNNTEFERAVLWLSENLTFDVDARINLFECNIRILGGLVSAHILATDSTNRLVQGNYKNQLLSLADDLGRRFLPAFDTPTGLPYAWINLKYGVMENETTETSTFGCGSLILEMGALSRLTGDPSFESAALRALLKLWSMRSSLNLLGTTLDVENGDWIQYSSGIGAGVDSFYEYLIKAHLLFGRDEFWRMFQSAYFVVQKYFRHGSWYHEADMRTGQATYWQLTSLQAFWPGLQVLVGDITAANSSHREFFQVWEKFGVKSFRYLLDRQMLHPTEKYYPLRPELAESTFYLYHATKDPWFLEVGESIVDSLNLYTKVEGRFASIRDVTTMQLEDHQHSFFLAETCKYLYLLFDDSFLVDRNYIFTTEGHPLPVLSAWHERLPETCILSNWTFVESEQKAKRASAMSLQVCPATLLKSGHGSEQVESACHIPDVREDHRCLVEEDCGTDAISCRRRSCSMAGYCGLWLFIRNLRTRNSFATRK